MAVKPGSLSDFSNSMAAAIEQAFQSEWNAHKAIPLGNDDTDRKLMFAAIAQGVVNHLQDHINDSLQIDLTEGSVTSVELISE